MNMQIKRAVALKVECGNVLMLDLYTDEIPFEDRLTPGKYVSIRCEEKGVHLGAPGKEVHHSTVNNVRISWQNEV